MILLPENFELFVLILIGGLFGYFLEASGLGSPKKINAQFTLKDWSVFKVMFTAVVVASIGLWLLSLVGVVTLAIMSTPTSFFWAMLIGGALLGVGLSIGGYCPGTSIVGFFTGRIDALFFIIGTGIGTVIFALLFDFIRPLYMAGKGPNEQTLQQLLGVPIWVVLIGLVIIAVIGFRIAKNMETKHNSVITSEDLDKDPSI